MKNSLRFTLCVTGLLALALASGATLCFAFSHPGFWSITTAGVLCVSAAVLAVCIYMRFEDNTPHKGVSHSTSPSAKPQALVGLDQFIAMVGRSDYDRLSELADKNFQDQR